MVLWCSRFGRLAQPECQHYGSFLVEKRRVFRQILQHVINALRRPDDQVAPLGHRSDKILDHLLLRLAIKIDQHIPDEDTIERGPW